MTVSWKTLVCCIIVVCAGVFFDWQRHASPKTIEIVLTATGFTPHSVSIDPGDTVVFRTDGNSPFWPASDAHPSHSFYPEFDPKYPIQPEDSWRFTFSDPGQWQYHNHLKPSERGTITVSGNEMPLDTCIEAHKKSTGQAYCWGRLLSQTIAREGVYAGIRLIHTFSDTYPDFPGMCHDVLHLAGQAAYAEYHKNPGHVVGDIATTYCGYGFYHGFIETLALEEGSFALHEARKYCELVNLSDSLGTKTAAKRAATACYHGIGHALFDTVDTRLWGDPNVMVASALRECETMTPNPEKRELCASGVYNSLANAFSSESYNLTYPTHADSLCASQPDAYKDRCYVELTVGTIRRWMYSFNDGLTYIHTIPLPYQARTLTAYMEDEIRHQTETPTPDIAYAVCHALSREDEINACIDAGADALFNSIPSQHADSALIHYCSHYESRDRKRCFLRISAHLRSLMPYEEVIRTCSTLPKGDQDPCLGIES